MEEVLRIRKHHLFSLVGMRTMSRGKLVWELLKEDYIANDDISFLERLDKMYKLLENPKQKILIIGEEFDFLCEKCPKPKREICVNDAMVMNKSIYPLKIGKVYAVNDIRKEIANF